MSYVGFDQTRYVSNNSHSAKTSANKEVNRGARTMNREHNTLTVLDGNRNEKFGGLRIKSAMRSSGQDFYKKLN